MRLGHYDSRPDVLILSAHNRAWLGSKYWIIASVQLEKRVRSYLTKNETRRFKARRVLLARERAIQLLIALDQSVGIGDFTEDGIYESCKRFFRSGGSVLM